MRKTWFCASLFLIMIFGSGSRLTAGSDDDIRQLLMRTFDRPNAGLSVDPVVVANDHAIADWTQDKLGGRALLRRRAGRWTIVLCSGDGIKSADALRQAGVPASDAVSLAARLASAEKSMLPERHALLSTFEGTLLLEADGEHPPAARDAGDNHPSLDHSGSRK